MHENEAKEEAREKKGETLDSFSIEAGSAAKGTKVSLKCYFDALEVGKEGEPEGKAEIKIKNLLKIRAYLAKQGVM